jgi:cysteine sulfinate desulfinase/cysteine desulfurase-like protein
MGIHAADAVRFSLGWSTTEADIDAVLDALASVVPAGRELV